jgi:hypothetical protein
MSEKEIEYNLKKINESLSGKTYPVDNALWIEVDKRRKAKKLLKNDKI